MFRTRTAALATTLLLTLVLPGLAGAEDQVVVKGKALQGTVTDLNATGVVFDPIYGAGTIAIPWSDIERIETEASFNVLHGDTGETRGRILGLAGDGGIRVGKDAGSAQTIEAATIFGVLGDGGSTLQRLRSRFRYWKASLDAGGSFVDATTDKITGAIGTRVSRSKAELHWLLEADARYTTQRQTGDENVTENIQTGFTRAEYDLTDRTFTFGSYRATRDTVQDLALRHEPKAGFGVRIFDRPDFTLATDVGAAYVHEDFFGGSSNSFWAVAFGADATAVLPYGVLWRARAEYVPAIDDWTGDYLIRGHTEFAFPMLEWLSLVWSLDEEYDATPAAGNQRNRFGTTLALRARLH